MVKNNRVCVTILHLAYSSVSLFCTLPSLQESIKFGREKRNAALGTEESDLTVSGSSPSQIGGLET